MKLLLLTLAVAGLAACSTEARIAALRDSEIQLEAARARKTIIVSTCDHALRIRALTRSPRLANCSIILIVLGRIGVAHGAVIMRRSGTKLVP